MAFMSILIYFAAVFFFFFYLHCSIEISTCYPRNSNLFTLLIFTYLLLFIRVNIVFSPALLTLELICTCFIENHINLSYVNGMSSYQVPSLTTHVCLAFPVCFTKSHEHKPLPLSCNSLISTGSLRQFRSYLIVRRGR